MQAVVYSFSCRMDLADKRIAIVGGTAGIGWALAKLAHSRGAAVMIGSRNAAKVAQRAQELGITGQPIDTSDEMSVKAFFAATGELDYLAVPGSSVRISPVRELALADLEYSTRSKFFGPLLCAKHACMKADGAVALFSGALSRRPAAGDALLGAINGAVEALTRGLAKELSPIRVTCISPGLVRDTDAYLALPKESREAMYSAAAQALPAGRVGTPEDIAEATIAVLVNRYMTGSVVDVDGGAVIR